MAAMEKKRVEMKTRRVETGWFYAAPAVLNSLNHEAILASGNQVIHLQMLFPPFEK
jgi:hypothetical protein